MIYNTIEAQVINEWLKKQAQKPPGYSSGPLFRLVWSSDQYELRKGTFCLYSGETLIREVVGVERVKKYQYFEDRWVLEQWYPPELVQTEELPESNIGSYEPLYPFEGSKGQALPLNLTVVQFLVSRIQNKAKSSGELIRSTIAEEMTDREAAQFDFDMEYLECSPVQSNLHHGEGIIVPSVYEVESPNLRNKK